MRYARYDRWKYQIYHRVFLNMTGKPKIFGMACHDRVANRKMNAARLRRWHRESHSAAWGTTRGLLRDPSPIHYQGAVWIRYRQEDVRMRISRRTFVK